MSSIDYYRSCRAEAYSRAAILFRDVTKREVSPLFSMVAAWLRSGRLADQNNYTPYLPLHRHGPWTGERGETSRTLSSPSPPTVLYPSFLAFPWWLTPLVSPPACLLWCPRSPKRSPATDRPILVRSFRRSCDLFLRFVLVESVASEEWRFSCGIWLSESPRHLSKEENCPDYFHFLWISFIYYEF